MGPVEAGQGKEGAAEKVGVNPQSFGAEKVEFIDLKADKDGAEEGGHQEPELDAALVAFVGGGEGAHHGEAAAQEDEGADGGDGDVDDVDGVRADEALPAIDHIGGDEGAEKEAVGGQENPHEEFPVVDAGGSGVFGPVFAGVLGAGVVSAVGLVGQLYPS